MFDLIIAGLWIVGGLWLLSKLGKSDQEKKEAIRNQFLLTVQGLEVGSTPFWWTVNEGESFSHRRMVQRIKRLDFSLAENLQVSCSGVSFPISSISEHRKQLLNGLSAKKKLYDYLKRISSLNSNVIWYVEFNNRTTKKYEHHEFVEVFVNRPNWEWIECQMCETNQKFVLNDLGVYFDSLWSIVQRRNDVSHFLEWASLECSSYRYRIGRMKLNHSEILEKLKSDKISSLTKVEISDATSLKLWQLKTKEEYLRPRWEAYNHVHKFLSLNQSLVENSEWKLNYFGKNTYSFRILLRKFLSGEIAIDQKLISAINGRKILMRSLPRSTLSFLRYCVGDADGDICQKTSGNGKHVAFLNYVHPEIKMSVADYLLRSKC